jgi:heme-degrading monooxygenase HmoA
VQSFEAWKPVFDELGKTRQEQGSDKSMVFRNADDPGEVIILTEWDSLDSARSYAQSPDLREGMQRAGVIERPDVYFLEEA